MAPDDARSEDVRSWLLKADEDLRAASYEMSVPEAGLWSDVVFHAQQAAEKALKAFLAWHDVPFRKTHNLDELGRQCLALDTSLRTYTERAVPLTEYAWKFRYPGEPDRPSREEAEEAVRIARDVYEAILATLPEKVRP